MLFITKPRKNQPENLRLGNLLEGMKKLIEWEVRREYFSAYRQAGLLNVEMFIISLILPVKTGLIRIEESSTLSQL